MSQENVEVVVRGYELLASLDWEGAAELLDPNVEQHGTVGGLEEGLVVRGVGQVIDSYLKAEESWMSTGWNWRRSSTPVTVRSSSSASTSAVRAASSSSWWRPRS